MTQDADDKALSRREFNVAAAAGVAAAASGGAAQAAAPVKERAVSIKTADGTTDAVLVSPGAGPAPAVILYPDAFGLRPTMVDMAKRLAGEGYTVLVINPFYRVRPAPVFEPGFSFANPDNRATLMKMIGALDHDSVTRDAKAFVAFLDAQPEVKKTAKIGAVGFCMGGSMTVRAAAAVPARVGAAVSFHGGALVTEAPTSPHKLVAATKATYHFGVAADDDAKDPNAVPALKAALEAAKRPFEQEVYPGTKHGWVVADSQAYDKPQAERAWTAMLATYKMALA